MSQSSIYNNQITGWANSTAPAANIYYPQTTTTTFTSGAPVYPPKRESRVRRFFRDLGLRLASERGGGTLPAMGGGAPDAETQRTTEHKKKITLERKVGVPRDKGSGIEEIHHGSIFLVRTVEGDVVQTRSIGVKVEPKNGSNYVEIPADELLAAVQELADEDVKNGTAT